MREAYSLYVERTAEGANAADGPLSAAWAYFASSTEQGERRTILWAVLPMIRSKMRLCP